MDRLTGKPADKYKIMVVDDEPDILNLLEKALNIEGYYNIIKIDKGLMAVNACKETHPDVIILDVMLPDLDGYSLFARFCFFPLKMMSWTKYLALPLAGTTM